MPNIEMLSKHRPDPSTDISRPADWHCKVLGCDGVRDWRMVGNRAWRAGQIFTQKEAFWFRINQMINPWFPSYWFIIWFKSWEVQMISRQFSAMGIIPWISKFLRWDVFFFKLELKRSATNKISTLIRWFRILLRVSQLCFGRIFWFQST